MRALTNNEKNELMRRFNNISIQNLEKGIIQKEKQTKINRLSGGIIAQNKKRREAKKILKKIKSKQEKSCIPSYFLPTRTKKIKDLENEIIRLKVLTNRARKKLNEITKSMSMKNKVKKIWSAYRGGNMENNANLNAMIRSIKSKENENFRRLIENNHN